MRVTERRKRWEFSPKKRPSQERSRRTFDAIVEACTWLLPREGFARTTTNRVAERAGVNIASLYEYFPGKDAIVAQVAERMVERVLGRLAEGAERVFEADPDEAVRLWIRIVYDTVAREKALVKVFTREVPYTNDLPAMRDVGARLLDFSQAARARAAGFVRDDFTKASLHLLVNLVTSTILQLVQAPPRDVDGDALLDELARRVEEWIRDPTFRPRR